MARRRRRGPPYPRRKGNRLPDRHAAARRLPRGRIVAAGLLARRFRDRANVPNSSVLAAADDRDGLWPRNMSRWRSGLTNCAVWRGGRESPRAAPRSVAAEVAQRVSPPWALVSG